MTYSCVKSSPQKAIIKFLCLSYVGNNQFIFIIMQDFLPVVKNFGYDSLNCSWL